MLFYSNKSDKSRWLTMAYLRHPETETHIHHRFSCEGVSSLAHFYSDPPRNLGYAFVNLVDEAPCWNGCVLFKCRLVV